MDEEEYYMRMALAEARKAEDIDEVPIGAVIVSDGRILAKAHNQTETLRDVTAHAEMIAITSAAASLGSKFLNECTIYVTLEPCPMCAAALRHARVGKIVYAASDPKAGYSLIGEELLHPSTDVEYGYLREEASSILSDFFRRKRE